jgi:hypothetical protein
MPTIDEIFDNPAGWLKPKPTKTRKLTAAQIKKQQDKLIEQIYYKGCPGMQINVLNIGKLFKLAGKMLDDGATTEAVVAAMWGFAENPEAAAGTS